MTGTGGVTRWRKKPVEVDMIRWDGSDEALRLIRQHDGNPERLPDGSINIWVRELDGEANLDLGDWAVLDPAGTGVFPCREADHAMTYEAADSAEALAGAGEAARLKAELTRTQSAARTLGNVITRMAQSMEAARIEMLQNGPAAAMQWILNSLPDVSDEAPGDQWDGKETATQWIDRTQAAGRAPEAAGDPR